MTVTTGPLGEYLTFLPSGTYRVDGAQPKYASTTWSSTIHEVYPRAMGTLDFGVHGGTVSGTAWVDANGDGIRQAGDVDATDDLTHEVVLFRRPEPPLGSTVLTPGHWVVYDVPSGDYQVGQLSMPAGYTRSAHGPDSVVDPTTGYGPKFHVNQDAVYGPFGVGFLPLRVDAAITGLTLSGNPPHVGTEQTVQVTLANHGNAPAWLTGGVDLPVGLTPHAPDCRVHCLVTVDGQHVRIDDNPYDQAKIAPGADLQVSFPVSVDAPVANAAITATANAPGDVNPADNERTLLVSTVEQPPVATTTTPTTTSTAPTATTGAAAATTTSGTPVAQAATQNLAYTGSSPLGLVVTAAALLVTGAGALWLTRRRARRG